MDGVAFTTSSLEDGTIARGPFSNDRLTLVPGREKVNLRLKRPFSDGSTFVQFTKVTTPTVNSQDINRRVEGFII